ncbi:MAG TPA: glycosyltransferase [Verrucomicrobiae bacterium]|jgi:glycosyltransferase involved in cell wall biosynthesis
MKPLVSILIPGYNAENWAAAAIESALRQTWPRKEIIFVDDGSTDRTLSVADKFSSRGVFVTSQPNRGASAARNKAFSFCQGDYIQWLDADDELAPDKIARQMEVADRLADPRALLSSEWGRFIYRLNRSKFTPTLLWNDLPPVEWLLRKMSNNIWMQTGTWLVSRELTEAAGRWDEQLSFDDDGEYFCRVLSKSSGVKFVHGSKAYYRASGPGSLSDVDASNRKLESAWRSIQLHIRYLLQLEDSGRTREACIKFLQTWLPIFDPHRPDIICHAQQTAEHLGARVELKDTMETLRWKFAWMKNVFGDKVAFRAQAKLPQFKHSMIRFWDKTMFQFQRIARP